MIRVTAVLELNASEASRKNYLRIASEASQKVLEKLTLLPQFQQVKVRLFIFFPEVDRLFIFSIFKVIIFYFQKVPAPPPPQNQMVVPNRTSNSTQVITPDSK